MTPEQRRLAMWGGGAAAALLAAWGWMAVRGEVRAATVGKADSLHATYLDLYAPDKPPGFEIEKAQQELRGIANQQADELRAAEAALAPAIAAPYLVESLSAAASQVTADYAALRQQSARTKIVIPAALPYETGLDADAAARGRQLATLALVRQAVQSCMHAGVARVLAVNPAAAAASPGGEYAVFACDLEVEGDWTAMARLVSALAQADGRGLGLRQLEVQVPPDRPARTRLTATMTVANRPAWGLAAMPAAQPAGAAPAEGGSRIRRLGARP